MVYKILIVQWEACKPLLRHISAHSCLVLERGFSYFQNYFLLVANCKNQWMSQSNETFEKCSILFKAKAGENFNHRNTLSISRIELKLHSVQNVEPNAGIGEKGAFFKDFVIKAVN